MGFLLLAFNQISNNCGMLHYTSGGQFKVPMVIRGPGGVGRQLGAEHSQRLESYFQSIPGARRRRAALRCAALRCAARAGAGAVHAVAGRRGGPAASAAARVAHRAVGHAAAPAPVRRWRPVLRAHLPAGAPADPLACPQACSWWRCPPWPTPRRC